MGERGGRAWEAEEGGRRLQQFPPAALHGGCGALQQLLSAGDSFNAPGNVSAAPAGQLQQVAALQAQQQATQLAQVAALERYRRDQLQYQQLQQQLMQPFGGFAQPAQAPAYRQPASGCGGGTGSAASVGMPVLSAAAGLRALHSFSAAASTFFTHPLVPLIANPTSRLLHPCCKSQL